MFSSNNPFVSIFSTLLSYFPPSLKPISHYWKISRYFLNKLAYEENIFVYVTHSINVTGLKIKFEWRVTLNATREAWNENLWECFCYDVYYCVRKLHTKTFMMMESIWSFALFVASCYEIISTALRFGWIYLELHVLVAL